jgi:GWxTD domain-containing protein
VNRIDPEKFAPRFVKIFNEVTAVPDDLSQSFDRYYPGFASVRGATSKPIALASWGTSPEVQLLASPDEKSQWERLPDDDARREFVANFWVSRDPDPSTALNEWREEFHRRVVFADETFANGAMAGSTTDRGKVFVLLGPPARVRLTNIMRRRGRSVEVYGAEERWIYFKPQLPSNMSQYEVDFRFIVQPEYADSTMENDFLPLHALAEARKAFIGPH